jgi:ADP-ribose pyrophosphatase YjhB (NUDIX family)
MKQSKSIVKEISSGGFIFHKDKKNLKISVFLIGNSLGEWWIPEGKLETGESQLDAAYRGIKEETGFDFTQIKHIGFCDTFTTGYDLNPDNYLIKDIFISVFGCDEKYSSQQKISNKSMQFEWVEYEDALNRISFAKDLLIKSYEKFIKASSTVNSLYSIAINQIQATLDTLEGKENIVSIILYGSMFKKIFEVDIHDTDLIVVVKDTSKDLSGLFVFLRSIFNNLDFHIYTESEVRNGVAFYSREYVLEYLAQGISLYGKNIFPDLYKKVTRKQYQNSIYIRSVAHVQMVRKVFLSDKHTFDYKMKYLKKYIERLGKNILLMLGVYDYDALDRISTDLLLKELESRELIKNVSIEGFNQLKPLEFYYYIFCSLADNLVKLKNDTPEEVMNNM